MPARLLRLREAEPEVAGREPRAKAAEATGPAKALRTSRTRRHWRSGASRGRTTATARRPTTAAAAATSGTAGASSCRSAPSCPQSSSSPSSSRTTGARRCARWARRRCRSSASPRSPMPTTGAPRALRRRRTRLAPPCSVRSPRCPQEARARARGGSASLLPERSGWRGQGAAASWVAPLRLAGAWCGMTRPRAGQQAALSCPLTIQSTSAYACSG
mmetsp:Transcript_5099/g.15071  ORF Transcript_5099/g.15071 Transcript_5099/m.15071 type:complete len:217 (+) Transcript_5099:254-904(+)